METPKLGRYVIQSEIGRGAMGVVYRASDAVLERTVAIKTVNMALERDGGDKYEERFYREARAAAGLNHPNIVTVYDIGRSGDIAYMALELIEGVELRSLVGEGRRLPVAQAASMAAQVAEGLAYAHERGVVHRDIKPANIMVGAEGAVKITDFGIARTRFSDDLTQTGTMLGSPKYMSPEQVLGRRVDARTDIFSLGVILYEMLVGTAPFQGDNVTALSYQIVNFAPPAPSAMNPAVPELLNYIVAKMLAKQLEERYQSAAELARDLRQCEQLLHQPGAAGLPGRVPAALASGTHPRLVDTSVRAGMAAQTVNRTRVEDGATGALEAPPALGVSHVFDSTQATQRLAAFTGDAQSATQLLETVPRPRYRWRRREWLVVGGAALLGVVVAGKLLRGGRD